MENGSKAVAVTDHGMLTGGWFLYDYIHNTKKLKDIKSIIGCELYINEQRDELMSWLPNQKQVEDKDERKATRDDLNQKHHQIILCKNKIGYFNAIKIHNDAWKNGFYYSPTTTKEMIFKHSEGLIVTTTCLASLWCKKIMANDLVGAENEIYLWKEVFGEDFYIELQPTNSRQQVLVNVELIKLAHKTNTPMIVTNDVHYIGKDDYELHRTLLNMEKLKHADNPDDVVLWEFGVDDLYIKTLEQMHDSWKDHHKSPVFTESVFEGCIESVHEVISKIEHFSLESAPLLPQVDDNDPLEKMKHDVIAGLANKIQKGLIPKEKIPEYQERIAKEIGVISALNAENYINICAEMIGWCRQNDIGVGAGRGSAVSSLALYLLGITEVDPIKNDLLFERFLSINRRPKLLM